jgi:ABC-type transporter Mla maintaining outer membrane lipid asymmetry ATPase subunit MlaF
MSGRREAAVTLRGVSNAFGANVVHENLDLDIYQR